MVKYKTIYEFACSRNCYATKLSVPMHCIYDTMILHKQWRCNMATLQIRIDDSLKKQADTLFSSLGLDTPTAIRI